ncbi:MAG TPA: nuclear transport factor 2 family protein [Burkholderiales bacterium]|nr:nuclear transport factor 2 family protein [Burkholderiales bacterium]
MTSAPSARSVFDRHLELREKGELERDIAENYHADIVLLTHEGAYHGHDGIRRASKVLRSHVRDGKYRYTNRYVDGEYAYLEWEAESADGGHCYGWDGFVIRAGRIVAQMVYFYCAR